MVHCLKYSHYFSVRNLPWSSRWSSFFTISWSSFLCDYSWAFCSHVTELLYVCVQLPLRAWSQQNRLFARALPGPDPTSHEVGSKTSLGFPKLWIRPPAASILCTVASTPCLLSLWASALPEGQSTNFPFNASVKQAVWKKNKFFLK